MSKFLKVPPHRQRGFIWPCLPRWVPKSSKVDSADFDGTNDYMRRVGGLTGAADSKLFSLAIFFRPEAGSILLMGTTTSGGTVPRFQVDWLGFSGGIVGCLAWNSAGTQILTSGSGANGAPDSAWHSLLLSMDMSDTSKRHFYIDDAIPSGVNFSLYTDAAIDFTLGDWAVGAVPNGDSKFNGQLADFWFAPGQYIDFSKVINRRKFISDANKPVFKGTDGSLPTGTAPRAYFHLDDGEAAANFATNRGGLGGNFTITGTLTTGASSPSD